MAERREIDERDIELLLSALTDRQIAELYGMSETEVSRLRLNRRRKRLELPSAQKSDGKSKP